MTDNWHDLRRQLRAAETDRDLWADQAAVVLAENCDLRRENERLREAIRLLHVQLPLMPFALGPNPNGPDPGWAVPCIPEQRVTSPQQAGSR